MAPTAGSAIGAGRYREAVPGYPCAMPKDRDQLTPDEPEDAEHLRSHRGQGTGGTGLDELQPVEEVDEDSAPEPHDPR